MSFSIFKKLASAPLTKVGRLSLFFKNDGLPYFKDGPSGVDVPLLAAAATTWPVGAIFFGAVSTSPATLLGFGTWVRFGQGRMPIGQDGANTRWDVAEETGGSETITLTTSQIPSHNHLQDPHNHTQNAHDHAQDNATVLNTVGVLVANPAGSSIRALGGRTSADQATNQATTATNQSAGGDQSHDNMPPFITVYMWKRTA